MPELPRLCALDTRGCCRGMKPPPFLGERAAPRHLQRLHSELGPANRHYYGFDFSRCLPQMSQSMSRSPFPGSREVPSSSTTLASGFLLHALACVSKDAYRDRGINTLHCQKPTKWRLLRLKKQQACDTAAPAKGMDSSMEKSRRLALLR